MNQNIKVARHSLDLITFKILWQKKLWTWNVKVNGQWERSKDN